MNTCELIGNLTNEPKIATTNSGKKIASFTIAVNDFTQTDFINCVAWEKTADLMEKYFHKGSKIGITGKIKTRDYESQDGKKIKITEVNVTTIDFIDKKKDVEEKEEPKSIDLDFGSLDVTSDDLPF